MRVSYINIFLCIGLSVFLGAPDVFAQEEDHAKHLIKIEKGPKGKASLGIYIDESDGRVRILDLVEGGPAEKAGLQADDLILKLGERKIPSIEKLMEAMSSVKPGETVTVKVKRGDSTLVCDVKTGPTHKIFDSEDLKFEGKEAAEDAHHSLAKLDFLKELLKPHEREDECDSDRHEPGVITKTKRIEIPGGEAVIEIKILKEGDCKEDACEIEFEIEGIEEEDCHDEFEIHEFLGHDFDFDFCDEDHDVFVFKGDGSKGFHKEMRKAAPRDAGGFHCECCPKHGRRQGKDCFKKIIIIQCDCACKGGHFGFGGHGSPFVVKRFSGCDNDKGSCCGHSFHGGFQGPKGHGHGHGCGCGGHQPQHPGPKVKFYHCEEDQCGHEPEKQQKKKKKRTMKWHTR